MSSFVNFDEVKERVSLLDTVALLGLELTKRGETYRGTCPVCEGSKDRALVVTPGKGWYCFTGKVGGDQIGLVSHIKGLPAKEAAQFLAGDVPKETPKKPSEGFKALDYLQPEHDAVQALGFDVETAKALQLGYAPRGVMKGTVAVPLYTSQGKLAGYIGITEALLPPKWNI
jgi:DNA primase